MRSVTASWIAAAWLSASVVLQELPGGESITEKFSCTVNPAVSALVTSAKTRVLALSWHRLGPSDMPFEAKCFRHGAVAVPVVAVGGLVAASLGEQCAQAQHPDFKYREPVVGWGGCQPLDGGVGFSDIAGGYRIAERFDEAVVRTSLLLRNEVTALLFG